MTEMLKRLNRAARHLGRGVVRIIRYPIVALLATGPVWRYRNRWGRMLFAQDRRTLTDAQGQILGQLQREGLAITHLDHLFPMGSRLPELERYRDELASQATPGRKKTFLKYLWKEMPTLDFSNPFLGLALTEPILRIVAGYLEMYAKFDFYSLNLTVPMGSPSAEAAGSQRWHRDPGEQKICKVFLYLNNVDRETGPFTYVRQSHQGGQWRRTFPPRPDDGWYPPEGGVEARIPAEFITACTGRAGTLVFADTTGLHKGGFSLTRSRHMATFSYSAKYSPTHPIKYRYPEDFETYLRRLSPLQRFAIDNR